MFFRLLRWFYTAVFTLLLPYIFFRLWVRSLRFKGYRRRWAERLGTIPLPPLEEVLWVHAVSVGEALAAIPLIHRVREQYPNTPILMTTTTPTGSERVQAAFKDLLGKQVYHCYLPYDLPWTLNSFFKRIKPKLLVLMETELWPNLLHACTQRNLPVLIANARLSPKSAKRYGWINYFMRSMIKPIWGVAAQSALDAKRFQHLGISPEKVHDTGNIKFDLQLPSYLTEAGVELRQEMGKERLVWIAASTHEGEESAVLTVYASLKQRFPALLLLLVPRHPDRFNKVAALCTERGFKMIRRSQKQKLNSDTDIFLGDTMGEMPLFYAASDVAFVGGSFVPVGGHNLLEPAALGLPVLTGPQLFNFVAISELLINAKGATIVQNEQALEQELVRLLENAHLRHSQGKLAKAVVEENRGALDRLVNLIDAVWKKEPVLVSRN
ncbi:MAG: lipid IV(A) 3-deoxy-D-manno-octulosonic acid transferase [Proteobacteria bacterium]|nr:lipid IV(A) 3-deoxy-D-manno-octulosonic acid transferase [Pseudomonadota bacterium]